MRGSSGGQRVPRAGQKPAEGDDATPGETEPGRRSRGRGPWIAGLLVLLALIVAAAVVTRGDDGDDLTEQVQGAADDGIDAATSAGDDALDAVTGDAPEAAECGVEAATSAGGDALDTVTDQAERIEQDGSFAIRIQ